MTIYSTFTTRHDLASRVAALNVRELARVIGRAPERENWPELTDRELATAVIRDAAKMVIAQFDKTAI